MMTRAARRAIEKDLQKQLSAYIKTKPACDGLKTQKTEKARKNYRKKQRNCRQSRATLSRF